MTEFSSSSAGLSAAAGSCRPASGTPVLGAQREPWIASAVPPDPFVLLVRGPDGPTTRLIDALEQTAPSLRVTLADAPPPPDAAARALPDAVVLFLDPADALPMPSGPALIIVYDEAAEREAEACLGQGAQAIIPAGELAQTNWDRVVRHALLRHHSARRGADGEAEDQNRKGTLVAAELLPAVVWTEAAGGLLWRADDGHLLQIGSEVARRLDEAIENWTHHLDAAQESTGQELHFIADGKDERVFYASARKVPEGSTRRWIVLANEVPSGDQQLQECHQLLRSVGHELKSPLSAILMSARLGSSEDCPKVQQEMWQITRESAETLQEVIRERLNRKAGGSGSTTTLW